MYNGYKMNKFKYKKNILASEEDLIHKYVVKFFSAVYLEEENFFISINFVKIS